MPQYSFTADKYLIETQVQEIADKEKRTRSDMIAILVQAAVKERGRKKKKNEGNNSNSN